MERLLYLPEPGVTAERRVPEHGTSDFDYLAQASHTLNASLDYGEIVMGLLKIIRTAMNAEAVLLAVMDEQDQLVFERALGADDAGLDGAPITRGTGAMGTVWQTREPFIMESVKQRGQISLTLEKKAGLKVHTAVTVPLLRRGLVRGAVEVVNRRRDNAPFGPDDLRLLVPLVESLAVAVANARLRARAERRRLEYSLLAEVSADVGKSLTRDEALDRILKNLARLVPYDAAAIFLLEPETDSITSVLHTGYPRATHEKINVKSDEGIVGEVGRTRVGIIVPDVRKHPNYVNTRARTRSEMVAPMVLRGQLLGLFNLESDRLDAYSENDLRLLEAFSAEAAVAIDRAHLFQERQVKLEIEKELRIARTVQEFFSPRKTMTSGAFRIAGANYPSLEVSGDYYDFFPGMNRLIAFAIADVAGKGVPASLIMASFRSILRTVAPYTATARQIVVRANQILVETVRPQDFVTAFIGVLNPDTGEVTYCNAGHNPPVLMARDGTYRELESGGPVLGVMRDVDWTDGRFVLRDEVLVCYTDGATEARNAADEEFGEARFIESVRANLQLMPYRMCTALYGRVRAFVGAAPQSDDTTYLAIRRA
jgi:sigma-B regulation protein RsbU (phosphoserine phosphatase)